MAEAVSAGDLPAAFHPSAHNASRNTYVLAVCPWETPKVTAKSLQPCDFVHHFSESTISSNIYCSVGSKTLKPGVTSSPGAIEKPQKETEPSLTPMTLKKTGLNCAGPLIRTRLRLYRVSHQQIQAAGWETVFSHFQPQIPNHRLLGAQGTTINIVKSHMRIFDCPIGVPALFKGQLYTRNTIMKYKPGKFQTLPIWKGVRQINLQDSSLHWP